MHPVIHKWAARAAAISTVLVLGQIADAAPWKQVVHGLALFDVGVGARRNYLGDGWDARLTANYNNRRFDFGLADLTLTGPITTTFNFTRRGMLALDFSTQTPQGPLAYTFNINTGLQDLNASGLISIRTSGSINALGFYDLQIDVTNRGKYSAGGYGVLDGGTTDFDLGPINVTGNIFLDILGAAIEPLFGAAGAPNPFAKLSGRAAREMIFASTEEAIRAKVAAGQLLTDSEIEALIATSLTASILGDTASGTDILSGILNHAEVGGDWSVEGRALSIPEPTTLALLALPLVFLCRPRRRAR